MKLTKEQTLKGCLEIVFSHMIENDGITSTVIKNDRFELTQNLIDWAKLKGFSIDSKKIKGKYWIELIDFTLN